jgi:hypothetical protein
MQLPDVIIDNLKEACKEMESFKTKLLNNDDQKEYTHELMTLMDLVGWVESIVETAEAEKLTK